MKLLLTLLVLSGCEDKTATAEARTSLKVPLPDGWKATASSTGLEVGPATAVVLLLESTSKPFPDELSFAQALGAERVDIFKKESSSEFIGFEYFLSTDGGHHVGFIGVRRVGARTIWCSTTAAARNDDVDAAMDVCHHLSWEN
jgi:hypothetical protein